MILQQGQSAVDAVSGVFGFVETSSKLGLFLFERCK